MVGVREMEENDRGPEGTGTVPPAGRGTMVAGERAGHVSGGQVPEEILLYVGSHAEGAFYCSWNGINLVIEAPAGCDPHHVLAGSTPGPQRFSRLRDELDTLGVWTGHPAERACGCAGVVHYLFRIRWGQRRVDWRGSFDPMTDPQTGEWLTRVRNALLHLRMPCQDETVYPDNSQQGEESRDAW